MTARTTHKRFSTHSMRSRASTGLLSQLALPRDAVEAHRIISGGIRTPVIAKIAFTFDIEATAVCRWAGIDRNTFARRDKKDDQRLTSGQSAAIYAVAKALDAAVEMFNGDKQKALGWFNSPARALGGQAPISFLSTPAGADAVIDLITRIEHGVVS